MTKDNILRNMKGQENEYEWEQLKENLKHTNISDIHNKILSKSYYLLTRIFKYIISSLMLLCITLSLRMLFQPEMAKHVPALSVQTWPPEFHP